MKVPIGMERKTGVRKTIPNIPNLLTILIIIRLRFVNRRAGMNFGTEIFRELYTFVRPKWK